PRRGVRSFRARPAPRGSVRIANARPYPGYRPGRLSRQRDHLLAAVDTEAVIATELRQVLVPADRLVELRRVERALGVLELVDGEEDGRRLGADEAAAGQPAGARDDLRHVHALVPVAPFGLAAGEDLRHDDVEQLGAGGLVADLEAPAERAGRVV